MPRHHTIISGTGRAGTTFLMLLFTELGLDTGFTGSTIQVFDNCNAGMEADLRHPECPYIVKSPWMCDYIGSVLNSGEIVIDQAVIPVRDLFSAAESRRDVERRTDPALFPQGIPGGLWHTQDPERQESILTGQFYKLVSVLTEHDVPMTLLHFPRFVYEPEYLYKKISFLLREVSFERFCSSFRKIARPELVHDFRPKAGSDAAGRSGE